MNVLLWIIFTTFLVSLLAFIGIFTLVLKEKLLNKIVLFLVSLSAGALMGGAFLHLLPESIEKFGNDSCFIFVLIGFGFFFFVEKILHWRHCHKEKCPVHTFAYLNLFGDGVHNFIDGLIIAASFITDIHLGVVTTFAIALHEIPQEIGDFGVLIYGGFNKRKALFWNFLCALTAIFGGVTGYILSGSLDSSVIFLLPFAAGGFLYIAASDLIPEIRRETGLRRSMISFGIFILGILLMYAVKFIAHG